MSLLSKNDSHSGSLLRESEQKIDLFKLALRNTPVSVAAQDKELRYIWAYNQKSARPEDIIGHFDNEIFTADEAEHFTTIKKRILEEGMSFSEQRWLNSPGGRIFLNITMDPIRDESGQITGVASTTVDLTSIKQAEETLRKSEERYRAIHENLSDAFVQVDMEGRIIDFNDIYCRMLGYTPEEIESLTYKNLTPEKWHAFEEIIVKEQVIPSGYSDIYEKEYIRKDGTVIPVELRTILSRDASGKATGMWAIIRDITGRRKSEKALQESEQRFRQLADAMPQLVWTADADGKVDYYNERRKEFEGFSQDENGMWKWAPVLHPDDKVKTEEAWKHAVTTGEIYQIEHRVKMAGGEFHWYLSRGVPVRDSAGCIIKWYGTATDINDTKKVQEALKISEERYWTIFDRMTEGFALHEIITDGQDQPVDYKFLDINPAFEQLTGLKREDVIGKSIKEILPFTEDYWIKSYGNVALTGKPDHFENYSSALGRWYEVFAYQPAYRQFAVMFTEITARKEAEKALRTSEEKYRTLFENMAEEVHYWKLVRDDAGNILTWKLIDINPLTLQSWGISNAEAIRGKTTDEIFGPGATGHYMPVVQKIMSEGTPHSYEDYFPHLDKYFRFTTVPVGEYFITTGADITALKKAHEEHRQLSESLQRAQAVGKIGNWRLDFTKNELVWSDENYRIFGVEKGTPQNYESFLSIVHPDDREYVDRKWKTGLAGEDYDIEHRIIVSGEVKWVREKAYLEFDANGELIAGFGITQDITDRKNTETELANSRKKLDMALENANIGLWEWNVRSNELTGDERTDKMLGLTGGPSKMTYEEFLKLVHEEDVDHIKKALRNTLHCQVPFETIFRIKTQEGKLKYISSKAMVNKDGNGEIISLTGVNFDITDQKAGTERLISKLNEDLLRSNKELENFAFITSHDLQEPLRTVTSFTQLLAKNYGDKLDDKAKDYMSYSVEGAKRMYELINGLLTYSRISRKEITFVNVNTAEIIENVKANLALVIKETDCRITTGSLPVIFADYNQMTLLFQNLIANGIKFSKDTPQIDISVKTEKTQYIFSVKDNGIGIEPQYFEKIFQIFKRLMPRDEYEGTGIGLAICKRIIENHGGTIWVESEPGKGSVFCFTMPGHPHEI